MQHKKRALSDRPKTLPRPWSSRSHLSTNPTPSASICARPKSLESLTLDPSILDPTLCPLRPRSLFVTYTLFVLCSGISYLFFPFSLSLPLPSFPSFLLALPCSVLHHLIISPLTSRPLPHPPLPQIYCCYLAPTIDSCRACDSNQLARLDLDNVVLLAIDTYHLASQWL